MKRQLFIVLALAVGLMVKAETSGNWTAPANMAESFSSKNDGDKTITIASEGELALLAYNVNADGTYRDYTITLSADLNLSGHYWIPIGTTAYPFTGTFNGGKHTISNLEVYVDGSVTGNVAGLFGQIGASGTVKDVTISSGSYIGIQTPSYPSCYIGGIAGINNGTIIGCANAALVACNESGANMGGIAGVNSGTIQNCYNLGDVYTSEISYLIGGLVGDNSGSVMNCFARCTITAGDGKGGETTTAYPLVGNSGGTVAGSFYMNGISTDGIVDCVLGNEANNSGTITSASAEGKEDVLLQGRTLFTDGGWNTLCLPFSIPAGATGYTPIAGAQVKELNISTSGFDTATGVLTLNFTDATSIVAGTPYIIKWNETITGNLRNPVFLGVEVSSTPAATISATKVDFIGSYSPVEFDINDKSNLFLGVEDGKSILFYPNASNVEPTDSKYHFNSCRAYFHVNLTGISSVRAFEINFGDDEQTGIINYPLSIVNSSDAAAWYTLDGRKLANGQQPTAKGIYVNNGRKIVIK